MTHWFADLDPWLRWLLSASAQASVLVVLVVGVQLALGRWLSPSWRYALWGLVVVRLLMPIAPGSPWSVFNLMPDEPAPVVAVAPLPPMDFTVVVPSEPLAASPQSVTPLQRTPGADPITGSQVLMWTWAGGAMLFAVWVAGSHLRLSRRIARDRREPNDDLDRLLQTCRERMNIRRRVRVVLTDAAAGPALMGVLRPRILLPAHLVTALSHDQLRHVLMHELAHLRRHDIAVNWLLIALTALHWFNPLVWFAFHRLRSDREPLRDAMVLRKTGTDTGQAYGQTIIRVLEELTRPRLGNPALAGITESRRQMRRRIRLIADFGRRPRKWLTAIGVLALLLLAAIGLTDAAEPEADTQEHTIVSDSPAVGGSVVGQIEGQDVTVDEILEPLVEQLESLGETLPSDEFESRSQLLIEMRIQQVLVDRLILHQALNALNEAERKDLDGMLEKRRTELEQANLPGGPNAIDQRVEEFRQGVVVSKLLREKIHPQIDVTENDLRRYFRHHHDQFAPSTRRTLRVIRASDPQAIERINSALATGRSFAELAATSDNQYRTDQAGLFGDVVGDTIFKDETLNRAVIGLEAGQTTSSIAVNGERWWVRVDNLESFEPQSFDDARDQIQRLLSDQQFKKLSETYRKELLTQGNYTDPQVMTGELVRIASDRYVDTTQQEASTIPSIIDVVAAEIRDRKRPASSTLFLGQSLPTAINIDEDLTGAVKPEILNEARSNDSFTITAEDDRVRMENADGTTLEADTLTIDANVVDQAAALASRQTQLLLQRTAPRNLFGSFTADTPWLFHDALRAIEKASDTKFVVKWNQLAGIGIQQWETVTAGDYSENITLEQALDLSLKNILIEGDERPTYTIIDGLVVISTQDDLQQKQPRRMNAAGREAETNRRISQILDEPIPAEFEVVSFEKFLEYFRNVTGTNVWINWNALEPGVTPDSKVTLNLPEPVSARLVLDMILKQVGDEFDPAAWELREGVVTIGTRRSLWQSDLRLYDIRDLLVQVPEFSFDPDEPAPPSPTREELVEQIVTLIQDTIGRQEEWVTLGGDLSSIRELNGQLIVKTSKTNHTEIESLLAQLREKRAIQISIESGFLLIPEGFGEDAGVSLDLNVPADSPQNTPPHELIDDFQFNLLIQAAQADPDATFFTAPRLTQFDGQQAYVLLQEQTAYAQTIEEVPDREPKLDVSLATVGEGLLLEAKSTVSPDRRLIAAELRGVVTNLRKPIPTEVWGKDADGKELTIEKPEVDTAEAELIVTLPDRATMLVDLGTVRGPLDMDDNAQDNVDENLERRVLMLVKPTIIIPSPDGDNAFPGLLTPEGPSQ